MYRTHTCGELRITDVGKKVILSAWAQRIRDMGKMVFVDLRDRYGITQITFYQNTNTKLYDLAKTLSREDVLQITGRVKEREDKNPKIPTGDIEIIPTKVTVISKAALPPFTIGDETDGGEELRMKYRYLDLRRQPVKQNILRRHTLITEIRNFLNAKNFVEIETPMLIKSTPEGARDFIVPSRINPGEFYALPQSPQLFKQLLMVSGFDLYYQIVKCFRDEDLRADRQPEFTQLDCEMAFVHQKDVLGMFTALTKHLLQKFLNYDIKGKFPVISYQNAMQQYGTDKPDIRFGMKITTLTKHIKKGFFNIFDKAEFVGAICVKNGADFSRKKIDEITKFVCKPQIGAKGLSYVKCLADGSFKSNIEKFYLSEHFKTWADACKAKTNDILLILCGDKDPTLRQLGELRLKMANEGNLINTSEFKPLWVVDFPLLEWDKEEQRYVAIHHPFTAPKNKDIPLLKSQPEKVKANAYDLVINGIEIGGGSIRIHDTTLQQEILSLLGFTKEEIKSQFGFLLNAFKYGAPPHGGIALGLDRLVALFANESSIRNVIAFPKNNAGKDIMINTPSAIHPLQLKELGLKLVK